MTRQETRTEMRNDKLSKAVAAIKEIVHTSEFPITGRGEQYADFKVGRMKKDHPTFETPVDAITEFRLLVDFRGEYFSVFPVGGQFIPQKVMSYFRRKIFTNPHEAYAFAVKEVKEINQWYARFD